MAESGVVCAIGNFDGVHLGHQALLKSAQMHARTLQIPLHVLTFSPHPSKYFRPDLNIECLFNAAERLEALNSFCVQRIFEIPFDSNLATKTARAFFEEYLIQKHLARVIVVGEDFRFGSGRTGSVATLKSWAHEYGVTIEAVPSVSWAGESVSSTRIRAALKSGDLVGAREMLYSSGFCYLSQLERGLNLGEKIGFPTLNQQPEEGKLLLPLGVYVSQVQLQPSGPFIPAISNVGVRPTVHSESKVMVESFLLSTTNVDFSTAQAGTKSRVRFLDRIREERKFSDLESLKQQIAKDVEVAKRVHGLG